jgi:alpha-L-rhamnosidase
MKIVRVRARVGTGLATVAVLALLCPRFFYGVSPASDARAHANTGGETKSGAAAIQVSALKTENATNPLGIDTPHPRFRWLLESGARGQLQTAYQILIASSLEKLEAGTGDKWNSGKVDSDNSVEVPYGGKKLSSGERCYWKVRIWDEDGRPSLYSNPSSFEMGLLNPTDWQGKWIESGKGISSPLLRKEFSLDSGVKRARIYISGIGYYELYINGKRVGDRVLEPASSYYNNDQPFKLHTRVLYASYDVTNLLREGINAIGVVLGNGWYSAEQDVAPAPAGRSPYGDRPRLILQMNAETDSGQTQSIVSASSWKTHPGPITYNDIFHGETYDARLEQPGWDEPGFNDGSWGEALSAEPPSGALTSEMLPPERVVETIQPVRIVVPTDPEGFERTYVYDFGQLLSGWVRIKLSGPRGTKVTLKYGSKIYPEDDTLDNRSNMRPGSEARQLDTYILKGEGVETWEPRFTLHGFRYVEVRGDKDLPAVQSIEGRFVRSDVDSTGSFDSSNALINRIHENIRWTFMSSFQGILQDAADRAEREAWLGDPSFVAEDYIYNFDMEAFWEKWLNDIQDTQKENGDIPVVSPIHWRDGMNTYLMWPCWKSTYPLLTWYLYQYYGDKRVLEAHYPSLKKLIDSLSASANGYIISEGLGDHMEPESDGNTHFSPLHTPVALTSTAYYYYETWIVAQIAQVLGQTEDAKKYSALAENIKEAFNRTFFDSATGEYATGSQTSNALPLYLDMVPEKNVPEVVKHLVDDIIEKHSGHLSTGIIGSNALAQTLPQHGAADVEYRIATQTTYPSLGNQVTKGATAVCETYECSPWLSQNMKMFGSVDKFLYRNLAGISPAAPGYRRAIIKPQPVGGLRSVMATEQTVRGPITVSWIKGDTSLGVKVSIPAGMQADIEIPKMGMMDLSIVEGGKAVWLGNKYTAGTDGISGANDDGDSIVLHVGSGSYDFEMNGRLF